MLGRTNSKVEKLINWVVPPLGWAKLNTNGTSKEILRIAGYGGLLRDDTSRWIASYSLNIGFCSAFKVEL